MDACFKVFRKTKCLDKDSHRDSVDSFILNQNSKSEQSSNVNKSCNFGMTTTTVVSEKRVSSSDNIITDIDYDISDIDPDVVLRRHNRKYLYSTSTISSNYGPSSDEDNNETLDILYPLPYVNSIERSLLLEETPKRNCDKNGWYSI